MSDIIQICDRCGGETFHLLDNKAMGIMCSNCEVEMINIKWDWTAEEEIYVELDEGQA